MGLYNRQQLEADLATLDALEQEIAGKIDRGEMSGFKAIRLGKEFDRRRKSLQMKLVNAGQLIGDLRAAKSEVQAATSETQVQQAERRLRAAFNKIRWNSDGRKAPQEAVEEVVGAEISRDLRLDDPTQLEIAKAAQIAGKRVIWRPGGKNLARVFSYST